MAGKKTAEQLESGSADYQGIGRRETLQTGSQVGRLAEGQLFMRRPLSNLAHDHLTCMDAQAYGQGHPALARLCRRRAQPCLCQAGVELAQRLHHPQSRPHRPLRIIFVLSLIHI